MYIVTVTSVNTASKPIRIHLDHSFATESLNLAEDVYNDLLCEIFDRHSNNGYEFDNYDRHACDLYTADGINYHCEITSEEDKLNTEIAKLRAKLTGLHD